ncbi:MAG: hypothetical protein QM730_11455 [Anaerolineales bacterium]
MRKWLHLLHRTRQGFLQTREIVVILADAVLVPKGVIQFGGEGSSPKKLRSDVLLIIILNRKAR